MVSNNSAFLFLRPFKHLAEKLALLVRSTAGRSRGSTSSANS